MTAINFYSNDSASIWDSPEPYREFLPRWFAVAKAITSNRHDAEDLVQQAIVIAIEKGGYFRNDAHFARWVSGIIRNCARNLYRTRTRRNTKLTDPFMMAVADSSMSENQPFDPLTGNVERSQTSFDDRLLKGLKQLSEKARLCLLLRVVDELTYSEISQRLDIPEGTAMNIVHRSKRKLRDLLADA